MQRRIARTVLTACGAVALLGAVVAGARAARRRDLEPSEPEPTAADANSRWLPRALRSLPLTSGPARFRAPRQRGEVLSRRKQDFLSLLLPPCLVGRLRLGQGLQAFLQSLLPQQEHRLWFRRSLPALFLQWAFRQLRLRLQLLLRLCPR